MQNTEYSTSTIEIIVNFIESYFGLQFAPSRENDLMRAVKNASAQFGCKQDNESIKQWLCDRKLTEPEIRELSEQLTINETYFFREKTALELLSNTIVPAIMQQRNINKQPIRIWSAGCSSGEEAYSIAMWLCENFEHINPENLQIIATDISPKAISKALKGEYTKWSFRETSTELTQKYFISQDRNYQIKSSIQKFVTFSFLNLAKNAFPSSVTNTQEIDVIFCRNVLMYFSPEKIREVSSRFYESLNSDGWFITSQVELSDDYFGNFNRKLYKNAIFYSKKSILQIENKACKSQISSLRLTPKTTIKRHIAQEPFTKFQPFDILKFSVIKTNDKPVEPIKNDELSTLIQFCNCGNYEAAIKLIDKNISRNTNDADLYYLYANIFYEKNEIDAAQKLLVKTLYLNHNHLGAVMLLAYLLKQRKLFAQSSSYFKQAITILNEKNNADNEAVQLRQIIQNELLTIHAV